MDHGAILNSLGRMVLFWAIVIVGVVLVAVQSGVICITPMAWLLALFVGRRRAITHSCVRAPGTRSLGNQ